jgi:putative oxidoreductase
MIHVAELFRRAPSTSTSAVQFNFTGGRIVVRKLMDPGVHSGATSLGLLLLRLGVGSLMLVLHGWPKFQAFSEKAASFDDPLGVGSKVAFTLVVFAELACAGLVALGLATRLAAIPLAVTMGVAALVVHADDPLARKELALLYLAPCLTLVLAGAGRFSADGLIARR